MRKLFVSQLDDPSALIQNFKVLRDAFNTNPFLKGQWRFIEFTITATASGVKYSHNLNFIPKDVITLSIIGGSITFLYNQFDRDFIYFDATASDGPLTVRAFIGTYSEDSL